ncbi:hypothetical protein GCM10009678_49920 [Actinomadura kijaniata]
MPTCQAIRKSRTVGIADGSAKQALAVEATSAAPLAAAMALRARLLIDTFTVS